MSKHITLHQYKQLYHNGHKNNENIYWMLTKIVKYLLTFNDHNTNLEIQGVCKTLEIGPH